MSVIIKSGNSSAVATVQPDGSLLTSTKSLDASITGSISFIDAIVPAPANNGQMVSGASTPGSLVALEVEGLSSWTATLTSGVFTTSIYFEGSSDSTNGTDGNWISLFGRVLGNAGNTNSNFTSTNNQLIEGSCGGLFFIRLRAVGGSISSPVSVVLQAGAVNTISIGTPLPAGTNAIGHVSVDNFPPTQPVSISGTVPVSAVALPLPTGAATSANQATEIASLASIDTKTPALVSGRQPVDGSGVTQPVSAAALPLPTGAATSALQTTGNTSLASIDTKTPALSAGRVPVDGSGVTQPVSGTVTANVGTTGGLALDATLTGGTQKTKLVDTGGANVASVSAAGALKTDGSAVTQPVSGTFFQATQPVSAAALPLPTGAATAAKQPALGTAGTPSVDVISVQGVAGGVAQPVSGTVAVSNFPATQPISAAALPLPANAAQETGGNLATIATTMTNGAAKTQTVNGSGTVMDVTAKGTQGANFAAVQQPKDSGRTAVTLSLIRAVGVVAEALATLTQKKGTAVTSTGTSYTVAAGKTLRIQSLFVSILNSTAAINNIAARIRMGAAAGGAVAVGSDVVAATETSALLATIASGNSVTISYPDGIEIPAGQNIGVSVLAALASGTVTVIVNGYEY